MVSVVLLTGFLGSGKTSLLNRMLAARPAQQGRLALIVNEFGDVGIDGELLPSSMTRQVELPGGCICCVLSEDLDKTLLELLATTPDVETIIIETTGIAEPMPIGWALAAEPLAERLRLAAVITVVDSGELERSRSISPAVDNQIAYADLLVVSKTDLLAEAEPSAAVLEILRELNVDAPVLFGPTVVDTLWASLSDPERRDRRADPKEGHHDGHHARHDFETVWLPIEGLLDYEELESALEDLPANFVRIKGIARVIDASTGSDTPHWIAFHRVGARVSREPLATPATARVVALGPGVERAPLAACVAAAVIPSER